MSVKHAQPGDYVQLGACIGRPIEPSERYGRLVAIRNDECRAMERYVIRRYEAGDGEYPTGEYLTTWLIVPHTGEGCAT